MDKKQLCTKFAKEICTLLKIAMPPIRFVSPVRMRTDTQIAALTPSGVSIRNDVDVSPELFFAIAHELRHAYQMKHGQSLEGYLSSDQIGIDMYNLQPLEVDANAFAALAMSSLFGISPRFENMSVEVRNAIDVRKKEIQNEFS